ncbi:MULTISPECIES: zinc ribbon domain-containing protein YjdM [Acetobacter]|uniref:Protein PhnA n=1 Tax=Acetobacter lovaniensis TaxID=104100 RepID=A0A841QDT7_9PROT|nr:zinc ribbon domain-containing protein YjdM [Acetobacter lovaniensis]MBB6456277.1 protein PhnA [Acetobacter lovaniensis]MCI1697978.1 alkylphosphonate utilization protein [Acetobacter lovaniensis]MCI1795061.1 alkylphosphonate utilization protein [Acetobacter lovaniensis]MCP1239107.1 zinc ribbon domain-containing protein YjdM [Acetobacter lovaniensis]NHN80651.1 alkylphosphonate utilization protein [Acetobacter lovaniensis]
MSDEHKCPQCGCEHIYQDGELWVCPECAHEWNEFSAGAADAEAGGSGVIHDANGNVLADGDTITVTKDLKVKGSSLVVKSGTKVKNIKLVDGTDGHNIACKISGIGAMNLKSEFVKKS